MQPFCASVSHLWNGENNSEIAQQVRTALTPTNVKSLLDNQNEGPDSGREDKEGRT